MNKTDCANPPRESGGPLVIANFPMPPSINRMYMVSRNRIIKSKDYRLYEGEIYQWLTVHRAEVAGIREYFKDISGYVINVDATFHMLRKNIICLSGRPKRNDTSNRLKALHDVLATVIIGVDDSYFWSGSFNKVALEDVGASQFVEVKFSLRKI